MAQLRETTKTAEAAARAKAEFMAVMSHEIRTPMTAVLGMADLLMNDDLSAKKREYVKGIQSSGRHLLALINDILDFSRAEAKKLDLETIDFDLREVLEQVRSLLTPQAAERGLELRFERDGQLPHVLRGDPTRLKQVLVNLVGNGIKFTQRGSVTVAITIAWLNGRNRFRFEVHDTGIGIPEDKQGILFNAFSQMDASTTRQYGGSGLGLAISRKLVDAMGGEIGVESRPGVGSLFWFEVPLAQGNLTAPPGDGAARARCQPAAACAAGGGCGTEPGAHRRYAALVWSRGCGRRERPGGCHGRRARTVRPGADGRADAGDGRGRGDPPDQETAAAGRRGADPGLERQCHAGGSRPLSRGGHERRAHQADRLAAIVRSPG